MVAGEDVFVDQGFAVGGPTASRPRSLLIPHAGSPASSSQECHLGGGQNSYYIPASQTRVKASFLELSHDPALDLQHLVWHYFPQHDESVVRVESRGHQDVLVLVEVAKAGGEALN